MQWGALTGSVVLPLACFFIARALTADDSFAPWYAALAGLFASFLVLRLFNNYVYGGSYAKSLARENSWNSLSCNYGLSARPHTINSMWNGYVALDAGIVFFESDAGLSESGVYLNVHDLGRILIPWSAVSRMHLGEMNIAGKQRHTAQFFFAGSDRQITVPWAREATSHIPDGIGVTM